MKELGKYLKKEREKQGLSLEDLADRTKIHIQKLKDIEDGNRDVLPAKVFCVGLVKSYARELKIDMAEVDRLCRQAFEEPQEEAPVETVVAAPAAPTNQVPAETLDDEAHNMGLFKIPKPFIIAGSLALSLLLIFIISLVIDKMNSYSKEEQLPEEVFASQEDSDKPIEDEVKETKDSPSIESSKIAAVETEKPSPEKKEELPKIEPKVEPAVKTVASKPPIEKKNETVDDEDFSDDNFGGPDTEDTKKENVSVSDNKLILTALEPVRAEIVWSDGFVQVMLLKSKETKTLVFSSPITLRVNNGGAVQVSFNDAEKKVPGDFNKPLELKYP